MNLQLNRKTSAAAAAFILTLMGALGVLLYQNLSQWSRAERDIRHTRYALRSYSGVYELVLSAESSVRSYVITGSLDSLAPYSRTLISLETELRFLKRLEAEHSSQQPLFAQLEAQVRSRKAYLDETVIARRTKGLEAASALTRRGTSARLTAQIHETIKNLQERERQALATGEVEAGAASAQQGRLLTAVFLFVFLLALGALTAALHIARKRRRAEEELADSNARLQSVLDSAHQAAIIATDLAGTITLFSRGAEKMLGYSPQEVVNKKTPALIHLASEVEARGQELTEKTGRAVEGFGVFVEAARQGGFEAREWTYVSKAGRQFPVELVVTGIKDHNGRLSGFLGLATDISARKASQLQMRKLSAAIKASPTSIVITDKDGLIEYANPKFFALTGYAEKDLLGQNPRLIASGKTPKETYKAMWDTLLAGSEWQGELLNRKKSGELFWEHASISPVKDPLGRITSFVAVKLDITDRKLAQRETERARDSAVELARLKSEFLANMSHEIRTPMNAIIGMTGLLLDTQLTPQQRDYLRTVNGAGEALLDVINDILDFSKIESGKLIIESLDFSLRDTVEGTADLLASRAQVKEIELAYFIEEGVPPGLRGDQGRLRQVLLNLMGNAVKFTERGEVVLRVSALSHDADSALLKFAVRDTGIGVPAESQRQLFSVFTQADASTTRKYGGTGLGLSISKKLVELMGGEIGFESEYGKGSTFWFTLPFGKQAGAAEPEPPCADLSRVRALIVDDNAANREIVARYLEAWKMRHAGAGSGTAALEALRREAANQDPFCLVILDMQMPYMDGLMLATEIEKLPALAGLPKIMMTSLGHEMKQRELEDSGISACLGKPVRPLVLMKKICQALSGQAPARPTVPEAAAAEVRPLNKYFRVLVAEDNTVNQKVTLKQLEKLGYGADVAANGLEVLAALKRKPYDLVLMDCQMPEMDGFAATAEIRRLEADRHRTPVVAMTANALEGDKDRCLAAGMDGYIPKPVRLSFLAETLAKWDSPLDVFVIKDLRELAGPENPAFLTDLARTYLADLAPRLQAIRNAVEAGNAEALRQAAHSLKGSSGNLGAKRLQKLCHILEAVAKEGPVSAAAEHLEALEKEVLNAQKALEALSTGQAPK